ncbi:MAG: hypothetical protein AB1467_03275 [Candidatus Diapherotrites archaeon]
MEGNKLVLSLSKMIDEEIGRVFNEIKLNIKDIGFCPPSEIVKKEFSSLKPVVGIYCDVSSSAFTGKSGDLKGSLVAAMQSNHAFLLVDLIEGKELNSTKFISEREGLKVKNLYGNLFKAFIDALSDFFNEKLSFSEPQIFVTLGDYIYEFCAKDFMSNKDGLCIKGEIEVSGTPIKGEVLLYLSSEQPELLYEKIK